MNGPGDIPLTLSSTPDTKPCSIISIIPTLGMSSCRGRAEAFARSLSSKLRVLGTQNDDDSTLVDNVPIMNGSDLTNTWMPTHDNEQTVTDLQPLRNESDSFFDFDCDLESPGSPVDECEYLRLIETTSNTPHNSVTESGCVCVSAASSHSSTDVPYFNVPTSNDVVDSAQSKTQQQPQQQLIKHKIAISTEMPSYDSAIKINGNNTHEQLLNGYTEDQDEPEIEDKEQDAQKYEKDTVRAHSPHTDTTTLSSTCKNGSKSETATKTLPVTGPDVATKTLENTNNNNNEEVCLELTAHEMTRVQQQIIDELQKQSDSYGNDETDDIKHTRTLANGHGENDSHNDEVLKIEMTEIENARKYSYELQQQLTAEVQQQLTAEVQQQLTAEVQQQLTAEVQQQQQQQIEQNVDHDVVETPLKLVINKSSPTEEIDIETEQEVSSPTTTEEAAAIAVETTTTTSTTITTTTTTTTQKAQTKVTQSHSHDTTDDDEDDCRPQRVRRCSSLKTGKTPPGTPGRKKIVRFADVLGLDLADIKTFLDEIPTIPNSAYEDLKIMESEPPIQLGPKSDKFLMPLFQQPGGLPNFLDTVREKQVSLENAAVTDTINMTITGSVRVRNLDFHKSVHIRYSLDHWRSFADLQANYVENSCDGFSDKFTFIIFGNALHVGQRLELAVRFQCKGQQFWDNNYGTNYCFQCLPTSTASTQPIQTIIPVQHTPHVVGLLSPTAGDAWCSSFY